MSPSIAPSWTSGYKGGTYGYTRSGGKRFHDGIDITAPVGTAVFSMYDGVITGTRTSFSPTQYIESSYGNFVTVKSTINGQTVYLKYNHLNSVSANIAIGTQVKAGTQIGLSGITGSAADPNPRQKIIPHVHIQAMDKNKKRTNPEPFMGTKFDHKTGKGTKPCK